MADSIATPSTRMIAATERALQATRETFADRLPASTSSATDEINT
jgi:hypothetical protein